MFIHWNGAGAWMNIDAAAAASDQLKGLASINYASQIHTPAMPHHWHHARGEKSSHQSPQVPLPRVNPSQPFLPFPRKRKLRLVRRINSEVKEESDRIQNSTKSKIFFR